MVHFAHKVMDVVSSGTQTVASKQTCITCSSSVRQVGCSFQVFNQPVHSDNQDLSDQAFVVILSNVAESLQLVITVSCSSSCRSMFLYILVRTKLLEVLRHLEPARQFSVTLPLYLYKNWDVLHISTIPFAPCSNHLALPVFIVCIFICIAYSRRVLRVEIRAQQLHQDSCLLILLSEMRKLQFFIDYLKSFK